MSFQRILVALDRSPLAEEVFEQALKLARRDGSSLILAHCLSLKSWQDKGSRSNAGIGLQRKTNLQRFQQEHLQQVRQVQKWLEAYCKKSTDQGVFTQFNCEVGDTGPWICQFAQNWYADLIVIGQGGDSGLKKLLFGSVSNYVIEQAPCKVMVVQAVEKRNLELQYAYDYCYF
jgi:nucleotide-binding universal stress UspA family protein